MRRLTRINCRDIHGLRWWLRPSVLLVVALVSPITLAKGDISVEQTNHPGIQIVSPLPGTVHEPGSFINFEVSVDPALNISEILVMSNTLFTSGTEPVILSGPPFVGSIAIDNDYSGPLTLDAIARDGSSQVIVDVVSSEAPASVFTGNDIDYMAPGVGETTQISPVAIYADGTHRHIEAYSSFSSSNPAVVTVTTDGIATAVGKGIAFIGAEFMSQMAYAEIRVQDPALREDVAVENTSNVSIARGGFRVDRTTGRFVQQVSITNTGLWPLSQRLWLVISDIPPGVALVNRVGVTTRLGVLGSPLVRLKVRDVPQQSFLIPGSSTSALLEFTNVNGVPITYTARVFSARKP